MRLRGPASHSGFTLVPLHSDVAGGSGGWTAFQLLPHRPTPEHVAKPLGKGEGWLSQGRLGGSIISPV